jgi:lipopolysaccharide transport system ATP-binding protein
VEGVSKRYRIGKRRRPSDSLKEALTEWARRLWRGGDSPEDEERFVWSLRDVSFEVREGEAVGIIGRNGAGKSTLLKILSRVTGPTEGRVEIMGRVGSLLEVGTGFHPELTGRENVYLNGAILGMTRAEIEAKFDEIVAFAEVERFLDTPIKRYSSGMYTRLAFAVAAHLEPEILIVDEVLAVGDSSFQRKCLGKMDDITRLGRTVLFVSHNMAAVTRLCPRALLLDGGRVVSYGKSQQVVDEYIVGIDRLSKLQLRTRSDRFGSQAVRFVGIELRDADGTPIPQAAAGQDVVLAVEYQSELGAPLHDVEIRIYVRGSSEERICMLSTPVTGADLFHEIPPHGIVLCEIPRLPLQPGRYSVSLTFHVAGEIADAINGAFVLVVDVGRFFESGRLPAPETGPMLVDHAWQLAARDGASAGAPSGLDRAAPRRPTMER